MNIDEVLKAIDSEPEFPGKMPDKMWEALRNDRDAVEEAIRMSARMTKAGIRDRFIEVNLRKDQTMESKKWQKYRRKGVIELRPYIPGEDLSNISISGEDIPTEGGMVARNPENYADKWYLSRLFFEKNYEPLESEED